MHVSTEQTKWSSMGQWILHGQSSRERHGMQGSHTPLMPGAKYWKQCVSQLLRYSVHTVIICWIFLDHILRLHALRIYFICRCTNMVPSGEIPSRFSDNVTRCMHSNDARVGPVITVEWNWMHAWLSQSYCVLDSPRFSTGIQRNEK